MESLAFSPFDCHIVHINFITNRVELRNAVASANHIALIVSEIASKFQSKH